MKLPKLPTGVLTELHRIMTEICDRPGHREQWAILLAGLAVYPCIVVMVAILVWFGTHAAVAGALVIPIFGNIAYGFLGLFALVVIALLGIIRKINATLPGGASIGVEVNSHEDRPNDEAPH